MPYITSERRLKIESGQEFDSTPGDLNYILTRNIEDHVKSRGGISYEVINEVIGVLECAKLELYTRQAREYENEKIRLNGDVYTGVTSPIENLAWAGGFFEGEGSFFPHYYSERDDGTRVMRTHASLAQNDVGLLHQFKNVVGFGVICQRVKGDCSAWKTSKVGEAEKLFNLIRPYLGARRRNRFLELSALEADQVFRPLASHCGNGHEYTEETTRTRISRGKPTRVCRVCAKEQMAKFRQLHPGTVSHDKESH